MTPWPRTPGCSWSRASAPPSAVPCTGHLALLADVLGDREAAAAHRAQAVAQARALGATALVARIEREARPCQPPVPGRSRPRRAGPGGVFRRDGEVWTLGYRGREVRLRDSKGLRDLHALLTRPGTAVAALDLAGGGAGPPARRGGHRRGHRRPGQVGLPAAAARARGGGGRGRRGRGHRAQRPDRGRAGRPGRGADPGLRPGRPGAPPRLGGRARPHRGDRPDQGRHPPDRRGAPRARPAPGPLGPHRDVLRLRARSSRSAGPCEARLTSCGPILTPSG